MSKPIVFGFSFGGYVAQAYATRHPDHPSKIVLASTAAFMDFEAVFDAFARIGGAEASRIARERWTSPTPSSLAAYMARCVPLYRPAMPGQQPIRRTVVREAVALHFSGEGREVMGMDFRPLLGGVRCPVMVMVGMPTRSRRLRSAKRLLPRFPLTWCALSAFPNAGTASR